jgi:immune inhibitor A
MTRRLVLIAAIFCLATISVQSMPLHQRVMEMMKSGQINREVTANDAQLFKSQGINQGMTQKSAALDNPTGPFKVLAILVKFSDQNSQVAPSYFDNLIYGSTGNTVKRYYSEVSYGILDIITVNLPSSTGWLQVPQTYAYYVDGQRGFGSYPHNAQKLAEDAVNAANPYVNFSQYDNNGDGTVDAIFIIHSGPGYEYSGDVNDIHSHAWSTVLPLYLDGVWVSSYSMVPEYWSSSGDMTCGVYAHELGHVFGLPDFYDYGYDSKGLGSWSLMAGGSWNGPNGNSPAHLDAWSRVFLGFANAINVTTNTTQSAFPAVEDTGVVYRLWKNGLGGNEYFLAENRQKTLFDTYLPAAGLMVYHVDDNQGGNDNQWYPGYTSNGHYQVALEQADGYWNLEHNDNSGDLGDPFPGSTTKRVFNATSTPNSKNYADSVTYVAISNISNSGSTMHADLSVLNAPAVPSLVSPVNGTYTNNRRPTFDFSDSPGATRYEIIIDDNIDFSSPLYDINNLLSSQYTPTANLVDSVYYWRVKAFNGTAWSSWSATWNVVVDATAPLAPTNIRANGTNPSPWTNNATFSINWGAPYDLSGIRKALYKRGSVPVSNFDTTGSLSSPPPANLVMSVQGGQQVYVWLLDNAGNTYFGYSAIVTLNYDNTRPTGCTAFSIDTSASRNFKVSWTRGSDSGGSNLSGLHNIRVKIDNGTWQAWLNNTADTSAIYTGLHGHTYGFEALNLDFAGNIEQITNIAEAITVVDTMAYLPGDANRDGVLRASDATYLVGYFKGNNPTPQPILAGDANGDCQVLASDVTYLVRYFKGIGGAPVRGSCR